jgi:iron(III) transport system substrate-binding protein
LVSRSPSQNPLVGLFLVVGVLPLLSIGCLQKQEREVVVYAALDKEFSDPVLRQFENETGITVRAKFDVESNKTTGLANEIIAHAANQRADLFWNNEILHTLRLQREGILEIVNGLDTSDFPDQFVSLSREWFGFAARARVLIVNTDLLSEDKYPRSILELASPDWKDRCGMARPFFGTTATHAAVLAVHWGPEKAREFFTDVAKNASIEGGNKQVAKKVARGELVFGLTDTDDAIIEIEKGAPVAMIFPDQADDQMGTLLIPNTLCVIKNGPNTENAKRLAAFLLRPEVEAQLAAGASAQIPLNRTVDATSRALPSGDCKTMQVDFPSAAERWSETRTMLLEIFER